MFESALMQRTQLGVCARGFSAFLLFMEDMRYFWRETPPQSKATHMHTNERLMCTLQKMRNAAVPEIALAFSELAHSLSEGRSQGVNHVLCSL